MIDVICMEAWRSIDEGDDGDNTSKEHTSNRSSDNESSVAEEQQISNDLQ